MLTARRKADHNPTSSLLLRLCLLAGVLALGLTKALAADPLRVAVAANFREAAQTLAERYEAEYAQTVTLSSASTGALAAQLRNGAPFDLLLAADRERPNTLYRDGLALDKPVCFARGSLVLLGNDDLNAALTTPALRIAIANPVTAPYGAAALQVLEREAFSEVPRRLLRGGNVLQAYQYFATGAANLALVARSVSPDAGLSIPQDWHAPIEQYALVSARSAQAREARQFLAYLLSDSAQPVLQERGYQQCS